MARPGRAFRWVRRNFSTPGLLLGTLFFAASLAPSLLPRENLAQGGISGLSLAVGYGVGVLGSWLWDYLELPVPRGRVRRRTRFVTAGVCLALAAVALWRASEWQNSVRALMGLEEDATTRAVLVGVVAIAVFLAVLMSARLFQWSAQALSRRLQRWVPRRISHLVGLLAAFFVFWSVIDGVLFSWALRVTDASYQQADALLEPETEPPTNPMRSGSETSLLSWEDMGRQGRRFVSGGPTAEALESFAQEPTPEPIRVYVGMGAAETPEEGAQLALEELQRVQAFDRSVLVLITPTGTGWVDPGAIDPVEYLHRGDIASVAAQYSYLASPLALLTEAEHGQEVARALFQEIYGYWTELPEGDRPELYLHGLSLGSLHSDQSFDLFDIIDDPFQGALWSGPPFRKETWRTVTARRESDSPAWLPEFRDGSVVRFANQAGGLANVDADWGTFRMAYLQYASDPITFFEPEAFYREPDWMHEPRGPDVSDDLRWFPAVTMLQLAWDMAAGSAPTGFGHEYAVEDYLEAWVALSEPEGWSNEELARLRRHLSERSGAPRRRRR